MRVEECKVVQVNNGTGTIRVQRLERDNLMSGEIQVFKGVEIPQIDTHVVCVFGNGKGFLLGELE